MKREEKYNSSLFACLPCFPHILSSTLNCLIACRRRKNEKRFLDFPVPDRHLAFQVACYQRPADDKRRAEEPICVHNCTERQRDDFLPTPISVTRVTFKRKPRGREIYHICTLNINTPISCGYDGPILHLALLPSLSFALIIIIIDLHFLVCGSNLPIEREVKAAHYSVRAIRRSSRKAIFIICPMPLSLSLCFSIFHFFQGSWAHLKGNHPHYSLFFSSTFFCWLGGKRVL